MGEWQRLVHVCRGWRQIIYASPRYLDLLLCYSRRMPVGSLSYWLAFHIAISYGILNGEDDAVALLKHPGRVRLVDLSIASSRLEKVVAAMQEPFPVLTHLKLFACVDLPDVPVPVLPSGFLGGSTPCLQQVHICHIPFPELPALLLSARDLVSL
ncbi:hypothetical protein H4582DRAFT_183062 [Lactarius indigo]|nr:hypothetical protein H4582DRAFT_411852 [Lactarius indigo]KAI9438585.1 hypothetical protein H4582DRAFT_183062 [Lactarius indigo]